MLKFLSPLLLSLLISCGSPIEPCSVEINADSLFSGYLVPKTGAMYLSDIRPDWILDDRAVGGHSLAALAYGNKYPIIGTPPFDVVTHPSSIILIELGGNDAYIGYTAEQFEYNLRWAVSTIRANGKIPVLTGIVPFEPGPVFTASVVAKDVSFNSIIHKVAKELNIVDAYIDTVDFNPKVDTIDQIHRTEPALIKIIDRIALTIDPLCR